MQPVNDWTTFVVICVGACLLGSCLAFATDLDDDDSSTRVVAEEPSQIDIGSMREQQEYVQRVEVVVGGISSDVNEIAASVRASRFARLDAYAQDHHWSVGVQPPPVDDGDGTLAWWAEWCGLKPEADTLAGDVPSE